MAVPDPLPVKITDDNATGNQVVGCFATTPVAAFDADSLLSPYGLSVRDFAEANPGDTAESGHPGIVQISKRVDEPTTLSASDGAFAFTTMDKKGALWTSGYTVRQSDTYTATGTGTEVDFKFAPFKYYALQVTPTGVVTSWTALLQFSLDQVGWSPMIQHTNVTPGSGIMVFGPVQATGSGQMAFPAMFCRSRVSALTLGAGTNVVVRWIACP